MKYQLTLLGLLGCLLFSFQVSATSVLPISLQQLSSRAALIFYGEVLDNQVINDRRSGRIATLTRFRIIELIKGEAEQTHTIKQIGGYHSDTDTRLHIHGVPVFQPGEKYVVFLPVKSPLGFSSPLGLHQGNFPVLTVNDEQFVSHGGNLSGHRPASTLPPDDRPAQLPLAVSTKSPYRSRLRDFINTVRAYNSR